MHNCKITLRRIDLTVMKMLKMIVKGLFYLSVGYFVYLASLFIPKNRNICIFGSWFGNKYPNNSNVLYFAAGRVLLRFKQFAIRKKECKVYGTYCFKEVCTYYVDLYKGNYKAHY